MALIFVSCGQANSEERNTAAAVKAWLESQGYEVFVALETQSLNDINSGTIGTLRRADYFIFIDFPREQLLDNGIAPNPPCRGSLFTHQELALAYLLDFPEAIFLKHAQVELKGIAQFQMANAAPFSRMAEVLPIIQTQIGLRGWSPSYSRHLRANRVRMRSQPINFHYRDRAINEHIFFLEIGNGRSDRAAFHTIARLLDITDANSGIVTNIDLTTRDRTLLKWAGEQYTVTIFPSDEATLDAFAVSVQNPTEVRLHSIKDQFPRIPVISTAGDYILRFQFVADGFHLQECRVALHLAQTIHQTTCSLV
jgi:hypothetical protein